MQFLWPHYNWLGVPLSFYALGPCGFAVEAAFIALAPGLATLGVAWYLALDQQARSSAPLVLFAAAAIALCILSIEHTDLQHQPPPCTASST